jgi:hypothetical protein
VIRLVAGRLKLAAPQTIALDNCPSAPIWQRPDAIVDGTGAARSIP